MEMSTRGGAAAVANDIFCICNVPPYIPLRTNICPLSKSGQCSLLCFQPLRRFFFDIFYFLATPTVSRLFVYIYSPSWTSVDALEDLWSLLVCLTAGLGYIKGAFRYWIEIDLILRMFK